MSGIAGIFHLDGRPVEPDVLREVTDTLTHRGPDSQHVWLNSTVGLGHCMLHTTPESYYEIQPLEKPEAAIVLVADARLDNRDELMRILDLAGQNGQPVPDADIILAAYEKWGQACAEHLVGAFAFAIWDAKARRLYAARDHVGVKPFYYSFNKGNAFIFASEIKAILPVLQGAWSINETRIADYLASIFLSKEYTFYNEILRLPPGHFLVVDREGVKKRKYWSLTPGEVLEGQHDGVLIEQFLEVFRTAVACRLRSTDAIGSELSGGIDSTSISCIANQLLDEPSTQLHFFSSTYESLPECDERKYTESVAAHCGKQVHYVPGDEHDPIGDAASILNYLDEPFFAPAMTSNFPRYQAYNDHRVRVVLGGHGGDETVSEGWGLLKELAQEGRWSKLAKELWGVTRTYDDSPFGRLYLRCLLYGLNRRGADIRFLPRVLRGGLRRLPLYGTRSGQAEGAPSVVSEQLARSTQLEDRMREYYARRLYESEQERHIRILNGCMQPIGLETLDHKASAYGIELRHPFCDKRLMEFCIRLPATVKLRGGRGRWIMRQAMAGIVPDKVRWRQGKTNFSRNLVEGLKRDRRRLNTIVEDLEIIEAYVDPSEVRGFSKNVMSGSEELDRLSMLYSVSILYLWRRMHGEDRPIKTSLSKNNAPKDTEDIAR